MNRSLAPASLAGVLLLLATGCVRTQPEDPAATQVAPSEPVSPVTPAAVTLDPETRGWETGKKYRYRLKMTSALGFGEQGNAFDFDVVGHLALVPVTTSATKAALHATLDDARIESRVPGGQPAFDKIAAELRAAGFFVDISGGKVAEMRLRHGLSPVGANVYRTLAAALQFARASADADRYTSEEYDTTGLFVAEYGRAGDATTWHKRKQRYLGLLEPRSAGTKGPGKIVPRVIASEGTVRLTSDGRPERVETKDEVAIDGAQTPVHSTTSVLLESGAVETAVSPAGGWQSLLDGTDLLAADEPYGAEASLAALDEARINGATFGKVIARLEQIARDPTRGPVASPINGQPLDADEQTRREATVREHQTLFEALSAIFRQHPEAISLALQKVRAGSPASSVVIDAFGTASTSASHHALVELAQSKSSSAVVRSQATNALARSSNPDNEAIEALRAMLVDDPFKSKALFGLGTYSRKLRESGQLEKSRELGEFVADRLKLAKADIARITVLRAIANSGYEGALPQVVPYLSNDNEQVRVAAVRALQSMHDPKVDELLASILTNETLSSVRIAALDSSAVREPNEPFARALRMIPTDEPDAHVRYRAVELMIAWMDRRPDLRAALEQIATSDEEGQVRERAKAAL